MPTKNEEFGYELGKNLLDLEDIIIEVDSKEIGPLVYSDDAFRASIKIFMSILMTKMWDMQKKENMDLEDRSLMSTKLGEDLRKLIKVYTNIDTHKLFE